ncbi:hypothetical protein F4861DRAFT_377308 [Xylaria intraflava]|nr:hypothetical protein F4861DRAFT_377308 [Xylaria intraflava]
MSRSFSVQVRVFLGSAGVHPIDVVNTACVVRDGHCLSSCSRGQTRKGLRTRRYTSQIFLISSHTVLCMSSTDQPSNSQFRFNFILFGFQLFADHQPRFSLISYASQLGSPTALLAAGQRGRCPPIDGMLRIHCCRDSKSDVCYSVTRALFIAVVSFSLLKTNTLY